ncbi:NAD(P)H pyrophosphatase NUDT13, mitochondrial isoform X2 [Heteronotia binoei]|uniref:NAD(P)H pyrophosphatase NUDT13, mitochondrial isoform X2 n=1 Tax=Heteronotia binoei TaxID=13085 RepID=UPI002931E20C|nr:NAD(P)H pyrophosphatase NUDT13, mitochondrial isoform X2 [Heteronotia binoei]
MVVPVVCRVGYRKVPSLCYRFSSTYIRRMRYLSELKEDDDACRQAYKSGSFFLFHNLSPFLQQKGKMVLAPKINAPGSLERAAIESELGGSFADFRKAFFQLEEEDTVLVSSAQALLRWHNNNKYCGKTGQPTEKNLSGSKRVCHSSEIIYYPQMSPVVITLVSDGSRCLLVRQASFPKGMYTALSGFCDVGESLEETVRREVAEEVGLEVESLWYSASQHWPFPNSTLMIGYHATVCPQHSKISISREELEAAKWFSLEEVEQALKRPPNPSQEESDSHSFWVPPKQAIAHRLIREWVKKQAIILA